MTDRGFRDFLNLFCHTWLLEFQNDIGFKINRFSCLNLTFYDFILSYRAACSQTFFYLIYPDLAVQIEAFFEFIRWNFAAHKYTFIWFYQIWLLEFKLFLFNSIRYVGSNDFDLVLEFKYFLIKFYQTWLLVFKYFLILFYESKFKVIDLAA